jgi:DNA-binding NarL/FixJ family response regulator
MSRSTGATKVLLVDDHQLFRAAFRMALEDFPDFEVVGEAGDMQGAYAAADRTCPDVAVVDVRMGRADGIALSRELKRRQPHLKIIMLSAFSDSDYAAEALAAGALGYLTKNDSLEDCVTGLRAVAGGERFITPQLSASTLRLYYGITKTHDEGRSKVFDILSRREREVFRMLVQGGNNRSVASQLFITTKTVETHRSRILQKLDCHSIGDLIRFAARHALENW